MIDRIGDWMQTVNGRQFWPLSPNTSDVFIDDIAHALSLLCRFGGHCRTFYSVAEHSVRVSLAVPAKDALAGLMHDAAEAYVVDMPRPIKRHLRDYRRIEDRVANVIAKRFGLPGHSCECPGDWPAAHHHPECPKAQDLPWVIPESVKHADEVLLATEARDLMGGKCAGKWGLRAEPLSSPICPWTSEVARSAFLARFSDLGGVP